MESRTWTCNLLDLLYLCVFLQVRGTFPTAKVMMDTGNLTIMNIAKEDQGTYECIATNVVASVVGSTQLIVESKMCSMCSM